MRVYAVYSSLGAILTVKHIIRIVTFLHSDTTGLIVSNGRIGAEKWAVGIAKRLVGTTASYVVDTGWVENITRLLTDVVG